MKGVRHENQNYDPSEKKSPQKANLPFLSEIQRADPPKSPGNYFADPYLQCVSHHLHHYESPRPSHVFILEGSLSVKLF